MLSSRIAHASRLLFIDNIIEIRDSMQNAPNGTRARLVTCDLGVTTRYRNLHQSLLLNRLAGLTPSPYLRSLSDDLIVAYTSTGEDSSS